MSEAFSRTRPAAAPLDSTQWSPVTKFSGSPEWLVDARKRLARLRVCLKIGTVKGGRHRSQSAIESAQRLLEEIEAYSELPPVRIGPSASGGLGLEWRYENRDLDLDISPDGSIEYLKSTRVGSQFGMDNMEEGQITPDNSGRFVLWSGGL